MVIPLICKRSVLSLHAGTLPPCRDPRCVAPEGRGRQGIGPEGEGRFVRPKGPHPMCTRGDPHGGYRPQAEGEPQCGALAMCNLHSDGAWPNINRGGGGGCLAVPEPSPNHANVLPGKGTSRLTGYPACRLPHCTLSPLSYPHPLSAPRPVVWCGHDGPNA